QTSELEILRRLIAEAEALERQLQQANEEIAALEGQHDQRLAREAAGSEYAQSLAESNRLRNRLAEIEDEPERLRVEMDKLQAEIERLARGPDAAVVQIRPSGSGVDIDPVFVECTAADVVLHEEATDEPVRIRVGDLNQQGGAF